MLDEELIAMTIAQLRRRMGARAENSASEIPEIEAQMVFVRVELERLGNALLGAYERPDLVLRMIAEREKKLADLEVRLAEVRASPIATNTRVEDIERKARERLRDCTGYLRGIPRRRIE